MKKQEVIEAKIAKRNPAQNVTLKETSLFAHELEKNIPSVHVLELSTVYLLNGYLLSLSDFKTFNSYTHTYPISKSRTLLNFAKVVLSNFLSKTKTIENAIFATDNWSDGYFHWLTDVIPRVLVAQKIEKRENTELLVPKELEKYDFTQITGEKLNRKIYFYESNQVYKINKLILPSHIGNSGNYDKELMQEARKLFTQSSKIESNEGTENVIKQKINRKIYISRQKSRFRKINNEEQVQKLLKKYNYEIHYFEEYSFEKQIELMKQTVSLVGLHGAGLTNMLFINPNTKVLEIRNQADKHNNCYFSLASDLEVDYYYLLSEGDSAETHTVNVDVDIEKLEQIILEMEK
ncbi:glycosyltransferase family 61 protein [Bernardetia sp. Wsw4-3y2]|uniref:glycosyltransferase family 61 protein n=1 Tax=Bernardetia sp. Wsw4-3y2 TaxID=3127471 RepID=UPI0030CB8A07